MISLIKGLKKENIEALADLWENDNFQKLVELLRLNRENLGKQMLMGRISKDNCDAYREVQDRAATFSLVIKTVESCYNKLNKKKTKK